MINLNDNKPWYKDTVIYVVYPDAFPYKNDTGFKSLSDYLPVLKKMGVGAIHVLPFLDSPMLDAGFDVRDFKLVRKELGGNEELDKFIKSAKKYDIRLFMDLVVNHVSNQHEWYQKAMRGDEKYRNYFIHSTKEPILVNVETDKYGQWAKYKLGRRTLRCRVTFYENNGLLPHWTIGEDGNWYYHTYFPHQIDLNWTNPDIREEFNSIIKFWASKGMNFRIDSAPLIGKSLTGLMIESTSEAYVVIRKLHEVAKNIDPECIFLLEACQPLNKVVKYFGEESAIASELAYNFPLMHAMWASIMSHDTRYLWEAVKMTENIPEEAQWVTFLRNHDELSLEYASNKVRNLVYTSLVDSSLSFRGEYGIAGRTASFLNDSPERIVMAYLLLASLNGTPAIVYGDEYGKTTNKRDIKIDARDGNRGVLSDKYKKTQNGKKILAGLTQIFKTRNKYSWMAYTKPSRLKVNKSIYGARYARDKEAIDVYINLDDTPRTQSLKISDPEVVLAVNGAQVVEGDVMFPPYSGVWIKSHL